MKKLWLELEVQMIQCTDWLESKKEINENENFITLWMFVFIASLLFFSIEIKRARFVPKYYSTLGTFHQFFIYIALPSSWFFLRFFNFEFYILFDLPFFVCWLRNETPWDFFAYAARQKHVIVRWGFHILRIYIYNWALIACRTSSEHGGTFDISVINDWFTLKLYLPLTFSVSCFLGEEKRSEIVLSEALNKLNISKLHLHITNKTLLTRYRRRRWNKLNWGIIITQARHNWLQFALSAQASQEDSL